MSIKGFLARPWLSILTKVIYTLLGKPYFKTMIFHAGEVPNVGVDAIYNIHFIYQLDNAYSAAGADHYDRDAPDNEKVAIYLFDSISNLAEPYIPVRQLIDGIDEETEGLPAINLGQGDHATTRVNLNDPNQINDGSQLDLKVG
jgi:hypothetical protein